MQMPLEPLPDIDLRHAVESERTGRNSGVEWPAWALPSAAESSIQRIAAQSDWTRTLGHGEFHDLVDWSQIRAAISDTHQRAGTLTPAVQAALALIGDGGVTVLRIAHTPDWLPYRSVALLPLLLDELERSLILARPAARTVPLFLVVDADDARDRRMRYAAFPDSMHQGGELAVGCGISRRAGRRTAAFLAPPDARALSAAIQCLANHARDHLRALGFGRASATAVFVRHNLEHISADLVAAGKHSRSLSDFNTAWLSRLVNHRWGLPTLFAQQAALAPLLDTCFRATVSRLSETGSVSDAFWLVCPKCGSRAHALVDVVGMATAECTTCSCTLRMDGPSNRPDDRALLMPRLAAERLLDELLWNTPLGASYVGSAPHVLPHLAQADNPPIEVLWLAAGPSLGAPELIDRFRSSLSSKQQLWDARASLAQMARGRATIAYDLLYDGHQATLDRWRSALRAYGLNSAPPPNPKWLLAGQID